MIIRKDWQETTFTAFCEILRETQNDQLVTLVVKKADNILAGKTAIGLCHARRSLMSWVAVIPKEGRACMAAPTLLLVWHRPFRFFWFFFFFFFFFLESRCCCGQPWKWHMFWKRTCDGLCRLQVLCGFSWNTKKVVLNVSLALCQTHCKQVPVLSRLSKSSLYALTHIAFLQFLPTGQYGLCFGYCFSGPLPLRSHKEQVTFSGPFLGVPSHLDYTRNWPDSS